MYEWRRGNLTQDCDLTRKVWGAEVRVCYWKKEDWEDESNSRLLKKTLYKLRIGSSRMWTSSDHWGDSIWATKQRISPKKFSQPYYFDWSWTASYHDGRSTQGRDRYGATRLQWESILWVLGLPYEYRTVRLSLLLYLARSTSTKVAHYYTFSPTIRETLNKLLWIGNKKIARYIVNKGFKLVDRGTMCRFCLPSFPHREWSHTALRL